MVIGAPALERPGPELLADACFVIGTLAPSAARAPGALDLSLAQRDGVRACGDAGKELCSAPGDRRRRGLCQSHSSDGPGPGPERDHSETRLDHDPPSLLHTVISIRSRMASAG